MTGPRRRGRRASAEPPAAAFAAGRASWPPCSLALLLVALLRAGRCRAGSARAHPAGQRLRRRHRPGQRAPWTGAIRALQQATGDVVVVATVETFAPFGDIREYAVKMFENRGRGIGEKGKDNGLLVLLAVKERQVWIEVGYGLEQFITDGFAGETSREFMAPEFRQRRLRRRPAGGRRCASSAASPRRGT